MMGSAYKPASLGLQWSPSAAACAVSSAFQASLSIHAVANS